MSELNEADANQLYWETDVSVADIAARFDLSRRALYDVVVPLDTGMPCDVCGAGLQFANRLSRRTRQATCPSCGAERNVEVVADRPTSAGSSARRTSSRAGLARARADARGIDPRTEEIRQRAVLLGGAAIAGIALGTVATWLARRRD